MNAVGPENAELTLIVASEINEATVALAGAGQGDLVHRSDARRIFVIEQYDRLTGDRCRQAKVRKIDNFAGGRLLLEWRLRVRKGSHQKIEAEPLYPLK